MTVYVDYEEMFPDTEETRHLWILDAQTSIRNRYVLNESYCADRNCDCRMVRFHVISGPGHLMAVISYHLDGSLYREGPNGRNPYIEPFSKQGASAPEILELVTTVINNDTDYRERLERHYMDVKEHLRQNPSPELDAAIARDDGFTGELISALVSGTGLSAKDQQAKRRKKRKKQRLARKQQRRR